MVGEIGLSKLGGHQRFSIGYTSRRGVKLAQNIKYMFIFLVPSQTTTKVRKRAQKAHFL